MNRASNAFSVLQATAAIVGLAILLWSLGLPSLRFAEAANVTSYSDTLTDSSPNIAANHTITFTTPTGALNNSSITIAFPAGFTGTSSINATDIDVATTSDFTVADSCGAADQIGASWNNSNTLTLTFCLGDGGSLPPNATTTIQIGTNASGGVDRLVNPVAVGSYELPITVGASDTGETQIAIVDTVDVTASVDTLFTFTVAGTAAGVTVNTADVTGASTTPLLIPFGTLEADTASTAAQRLTVVTNARSGFVVTVQSDGQLDSTNGADIDGYIEGSYTTTPTAWTQPTPTVGQENSYGHWGITSDDGVLTSGQTDLYGSGLFVSASTSPVEVFRNYGPTNGTGTGEGTTIVGYKVEISALQEAAEDYQAVLTYIATPVF